MRLEHDVPGKRGCHLQAVLGVGSGIGYAELTVVGGNVDGAIVERNVLATRLAARNRLPPGF